MGTAAGGWRLIRALGWRIYKIRPVHGFVSQIAGPSIILGAALAGGPVSTTQVMSSSIMGAGSAERLSKSPLVSRISNAGRLGLNHPSGSIVGSPLLFSALVDRRGILTIVARS